MKNEFLMILILSSSFSLFAQSQIGGDINGEGEGDKFGTSVSLSSDGMRLAVGAPCNSGIGFCAGHVRVFEHDGANWIQLGSDIDGLEAGYEAGEAVSLSPDGRRVAIGARHATSGNLAGQVRVYEYDGGNWMQLGEEITGEASGDFSGSSIALSFDGSRLAIGAFSNTGAAGMASGHVRVYGYNGVSWDQLGDDIDGAAPADWFGFSVSLSGNGDCLAVGAPNNDDTAAEAGHVRVYRYDGNAWIQLGTSIGGAATGNASGWSVAISDDGKRVAIGAPFYSAVNSLGGHVRIFEYGETSWTQVGEDIDGEAAGNQSGFAVSLSGNGNRVAIGARGNGDGGALAGHVRIYEFTGQAWVQLGADIDGEASLDESGTAVSLSNDGFRVAIGAFGNDDAGTNAGHVRVFGDIPTSLSAIPDYSNEIVLYPNPAKEHFIIKGFSSEVLAVSIRDSTGKVFSVMVRQNQAIDISGLPKGLFFVLINDENRIIAKSLIKV